MTPIINSWWFYFIDVLGEIKSIFTFENLSVLLFTGIAMLALLYIVKLFVVGCMDFGKDEIKSLFIKYVKFSKKIAIICTICTLLTTFIPKKETMYKMMVANFATYENVESAAEAIKNSVDYIMDKLDKKQR